MANVLEIKVIDSYDELMQAKPSDILFIKGRVEIVINPREDYREWAALQTLSKDKKNSIYTVSLWGNLCRENEYDEEFCKTQTDILQASYIKEAHVNSKRPLAEAIKYIFKKRGLIK